MGRRKKKRRRTVSHPVAGEHVQTHPCEPFFGMQLVSACIANTVTATRRDNVMPKSYFSQELNHSIYIFDVRGTGVVPCQPACCGLNASGCPQKDGVQHPEHLRASTVSISTPTALCIHILAFSAVAYFCTLAIEYVTCRCCAVAYVWRRIIMRVQGRERHRVGAATAGRRLARSNHASGTVAQQAVPQCTVRRMLHLNYTRMCLETATRSLLHATAFARRRCSAKPILKMQIYVSLIFFLISVSFRGKNLLSVDPATTEALFGDPRRRETEKRSAGKVAR